MSNFAVFFIGLWVLASLVLPALHLLGFDDATKLYYSNALQLACSLGGGLSCLVTAWRFPVGNALRRVWMLIGSGLLIWFFAALIFASYPLRNDGADTPYPYICDPLFLLTPIFITLGMYLFKRGMSLESNTLGKAMALVAFLVTLGWGLSQYWETIVGPDLLRSIVDIAYAVLDPIMIGMTVWVAMSFRGGVIASSWWIVIVGIFLFYIANVLFSSLESYQTGSLVDLGWTVGFGLIGIAALRVREALR